MGGWGRPLAWGWAWMWDLLFLFLFYIFILDTGPRWAVFQGERASSSPGHGEYKSTPYESVRMSELVDGRDHMICSR